MKVIQLIDSLEAGGAERVAVNIANALTSKIEGSYLCATRNEGVLKDSLIDTDNYLFLNKRRTIEYKSVRKLSNFIRTQNIDIIHAHSSSFFLAFLVKLLNPKIKLVWQDHYGDSEYLHLRKFKVLRFCSKYFAFVLSVNSKLETWAKENLKTKSVYYLSNFAVNHKGNVETYLFGNQGKRILQVANLRPQKDHENALRAFKSVVNEFPEWTLHCVGKDFKDEYSHAILNLVQRLKLEKNVFFYGIRPDVMSMIEKCDIGLLSSKSEGLPLALLEYGIAGIPVVATDVGDCKLVISNNKEGLLIEKENEVVLKDGLLKYIKNIELRKEAGKKLKQKVINHFSKEAIMNTLIKYYREA